MKKLDNQTKKKIPISKIISIHNVFKLLPIIGIILFAYIIWRTGIINIMKAFEGIRLIWLLPTPVLVFFIVLLKGLKWKLILNHYRQSFSYKNACITWCIGAFAGGLTPGQAGEAIKALYVKKINPEKTTSECISTIASDKIIEIFSLMTLVMLSSSLLVFQLGGGLGFGLSVFVSASALIAIFYGLTDQKIYMLIKRILRPLARILIPDHYRKRLDEIFERFFSGIWELRKEKKLLANLWLIAIFTWFIVFFIFYILILSLKLELSLYYVMIITPIISFFSILPISISGIGTRDAVTILFFSQVGLGKESAVAWSILSLAVSWMFSLFGWIASINPSLWLGLDINEKNKPSEI